jgi:hypothetical protein
VEFLLRDEISDEMIVEQLKITSRTLHRWKQRFLFADALAPGQEAIQAEIRAEGMRSSRIASTPWSGAGTNLSQLALVPKPPIPYP